jgi:hypothetical protein
MVKIIDMNLVKSRDRNKISNCNPACAVLGLSLLSADTYGILLLIPIHRDFLSTDTNTVE